MVWWVEAFRFADLEVVACLAGRVRGGIVFVEGAVGDAFSACAPSEPSESMVPGTASPGWRLYACVPSGLWDCGTVGLWDCGTVGLWDCGTVGLRFLRQTN